MSKIYCLLFLLIGFLFLLPLTNPVLALDACQNIGVILESVQPTYNVGEPINFKLGVDPNGDFARKQRHSDWTYDVVIVPTSLVPPRTAPINGATLAGLATGDRILLAFSGGILKERLNPDSTYSLEFNTSSSGVTTGSICTGPAFKMNPYNPFGQQVLCQPSITQEILENRSNPVKLNISPRDPGITYSFLIYQGKMGDNLFKLQTTQDWTTMEGRYNKLNQQPIAQADETKDIPALGLGDYTLVIRANTANYSWGCSVRQFTTVNKNPVDKPAGGGFAPGGPGGPGGVISPTPAKQCGDKDKNGKEIICSQGGGDPCTDEKDGRGPAFKTAIGCIHTSPVEFVKDFLKFIIAISGGLAFLMMLLGAFQMLTSAGNPDSLNAGRERLTSAVIGLLFVIFAILLMQIIGFDILKLPGFGR